MKCLILTVVLFVPVMLSGCRPYSERGQMGSLTNEQICTEQTSRVIKNEGWDVTGKDDSKPVYYVEHHYNHKLGRCFVEAEMFSPHQNLAADNTAQMITLRDAFEPDKFYGTYMVSQFPGQNNVCQVQLISGQTVLCGSVNQFMEMIQSYMWQ